MEVEPVLKEKVVESLCRSVFGKEIFPIYCSSL